jgi:hypothetical protein
MASFDRGRSTNRERQLPFAFAAKTETSLYSAHPGNRFSHFTPVGEFATANAFAYYSRCLARAEPKMDLPAGALLRATSHGLRAVTALAVLAMSAIEG